MIVTKAKLCNEEVTIGPEFVECTLHATLAVGMVGTGS